jgi:histone deacetylase 1/2
MTVAKNSPVDTVWHPVTGATHHLTNDLTNLNLRHDDYDGTEHIQVGNGAGLRITKTSSSILSSSSKSFVLQKQLLVPDITKNLLSVHQFCKDNNVYFEF